eukprot:865410-Rhodomonas_salina.4
MPGTEASVCCDQVLTVCFNHETQRLTDPGLTVITCARVHAGTRCSELTDACAQSSRPSLAA